ATERGRRRSRPGRRRGRGRLRRGGRGRPRGRGGGAGGGGGAWGAGGGLFSPQRAGVSAAGRGPPRRARAHAAAPPGTAPPTAASGVAARGGGPRGGPMGKSARWIGRLAIVLGMLGSPDVAPLARAAGDSNKSQGRVEKMDFGKTPEGTPVELFVLTNGRI